MAPGRGARGKPRIKPIKMIRGPAPPPPRALRPAAVAVAVVVGTLVVLGILASLRACAPSSRVQVFDGGAAAPGTGTPATAAPAPHPVRPPPARTPPSPHWGFSAPEVSGPEPPPDAAPPRPMPPQSQIDAVFAAFQPEVLACRDLYLRDAKASGRITVKLTLRDTGEVADTPVVETDLPSSNLGSCVALAAAHLRFPELPARMTVKVENTYQILFR